MKFPVKYYRVKYFIIALIILFFLLGFLKHVYADVCEIGDHNYCSPGTSPQFSVPCVDLTCNGFGTGYSSTEFEGLCVGFTEGYQFNQTQLDYYSNWFSSHVFADHPGCVEIGSVSSMGSIIGVVDCSSTARISCVGKLYGCGGGCLPGCSACGCSGPNGEDPCISGSCLGTGEAAYCLDDDCPEFRCPAGCDQRPILGDPECPVCRSSSDTICEPECTETACISGYEFDLENDCRCEKRLSSLGLSDSGKSIHGIKKSFIGIGKGGFIINEFP